jgi:hypothetical protein
MTITTTRIVCRLGLILWGNFISKWLACTGLRKGDKESQHGHGVIELVSLDNTTMLFSLFSFGTMLYSGKDSLLKYSLEAFDVGERRALKVLDSQ